MAEIHSTAIIDSDAELAEGVSVGPYCVIGKQVSIGKGTRLISHVCIEGPTTIGSCCTIHPFASIGFISQDLKYKGGAPGVIIGDNNTIREYVTINTATFDGDNTLLGNRCHIMAYCHVAHDCTVGDEVIMANAATLAGHVTVEHQAIIGGLCGIHQFVHVGRQSIMGGCSKAVKDVPPFMTADGNPLEIRGINSIGLKRHGIDRENITKLKNAFKILYHQDFSVSQAVEKMKAELENTPELTHLYAFIERSERGLT
jgi:UDP-N-acetylglucosamine acyltransferase